MSTLVKDELTALEDLLASCYGAIYAYGVVALLEENAIAHWANALFYLPAQIKQRECEFLQGCAIRSFSWSGIAKAFSSAT